VGYESLTDEQARLDRRATRALARRARRLLVKTPEGILRFDAARNPIADGDVDRYLVHADGFLNVPVLVVGDLLVRGFTPELYGEVLGEEGLRG
jgi:hypothetical protein